MADKYCLNGKSSILHYGIVFGFHDKKLIAMDNKKDVGSPYRDCINVNEKYELEYWKKELGVNADELRKAVKEAGTSANEVRKHLKK